MGHFFSFFSFIRRESHRISHYGDFNEDLPVLFTLNRTHDCNTLNKYNSEGMFNSSRSNISRRVFSFILKADPRDRISEVFSEIICNNYVFILENSEEKENFQVIYFQPIGIMVNG